MLTLTSPSASATTSSLLCTEIQTGVVSCAMPSVDSAYNTTDLLAAAQAFTTTPLTTSTPMVITAFGGAGHEGDVGGGNHGGGSGGKGGTAQTITSVSDVQSSFGTTLYYYNGNEGSSASGGRGGASTLVSGVDLATQDACIDGYSGCTTNLLADAGGGESGGGVSSVDGTAGQDGIGGLGGPTHTSNGPNVGASWADNTQLFFLNAGQGGEGEFRGNDQNYGSGGGGGSFAANNTTTPASVPAITNQGSGGDGSVYVTFVGS